MLGGPLSIGFPRRLYRRLKKPFEIMERCRIRTNHYSGKGPYSIAERKG